MMCGCTAAKKTAAPACPAYPNNGLTLNPGNYCVTSSAASYEIGDQESTVNTYTVSATLQSNPPIPAGTPLRVGFENVGGVEGSFVQMVSTGSPTIAFSETVKPMICSQNNQLHIRSVLVTTTLDNLDCTDPRSLILDQFYLLLLQQKVKSDLAVQHTSEVGAVEEDHPLVISSGHGLKAILRESVERNKQSLCVTAKTP